MHKHTGAAADPLDFFALLKPRVMWLVVFTAAGGVLVSPISNGMVIALTSVLCIAAGAGAAGCLNMWYEADIDAIMHRTRNRPIPAGKVSRDTALAFGVLLSFGSVGTMLLAVGVVSAALLTVTILYYVFVYTVWLKRASEHNVVLGGVAGALPPVVGWSSTGASLLQPEPWMLFLIIFFWTPPHSWALALWRKSDYAMAGVPMMPASRGGVARACNWSLVYATLLVLLAVLGALVLELGGWAFHLVNLAGSCWLWWRSWKMRNAFAGEGVSGNEVAEPARRASKVANGAARALFRDSIAFMIAVFAVLSAWSIVQRLGLW